MIQQFGWIVALILIIRYRRDIHYRNSLAIAHAVYNASRMTSDKNIIIEVEREVSGSKCQVMR
jgi:hypothetical protein